MYSLQKNSYTPDIAPLKQSTRDYFSDFRDQALSILCLAGLAGLPQITLPISELDSAPLGLSIIGSPGQDEFLLQVARKIIRELNISPLR